MKKFLLAAIFVSSMAVADDKPASRERERGAEPERRARLPEKPRDREHAEARERDARARKAEHDQGPEAVERRLHHLFAAAENLEAAGRHDLAGQLHREAVQMQEELEHRVRAERGKGPAPSNAELAQAVHQLQRQVHELSEVVSKLHRELAERRR
jgi:hypothetical protein